MEKHKLSPEQKEVTEQYERFCQHSWDCLPRPGKNATFKYYQQQGTITFETCGCDIY
ncbi:hypothetical protein [Bacillus cereus group sp. N24]|uniref:hypothetical protein n=1 Tax=Bacillus cereus group sp. N24 TaxID=2794592 RepID=UPI0018F73F59|nr:hypothetical protein [Bacillus cereus group sp. N24]MBJ7950103.1 hypothetical protein [Bacillus cereus group sp. N24]